MPHNTTKEVNATKEDVLTTKDSPPPSSFSKDVELMSENVTEKELEISQHLFNTHSTTIQQPSTVDLIENESIVDEEKDTDPPKFIQHTFREEGERGYVELVQFDDILQAEQQVDSIATQKDTFSKTNSLDSTSQQEAFNRKYQPVEVLNSDSEWVRGYYVHKCLVVANLEGIERKYAPFDELGAKYVFLGEIRLPRVG